jgi:amidase
VRLGVLTRYVNHTTDETTPEIVDMFWRAVDILRRGGAVVVEVDSPKFDPVELSHADVSLFEFAQSVDSYLSHPTRLFCPANLAEIVSTQLVDESAVGHSWTLAQTLSISHAEYSSRLDRIRYLQSCVATVFASHSLSALIYPHQTILPVRINASEQRGRNGLLTSLTGLPGIVLPQGASTASVRAPVGVPVGMEVIGLWGDDDALIRTAEVISQSLRGRVEPKLLCG